MTIRFDDRVAIVTGAGNGLGKSHALALAARGCKVVVNDLGGSVDGSGAGSATLAEQVVAEIKAAGGEAIANGANVTNYNEVEAMVAQAKAEWGRVDILINNAGILRDKSFAKADLDNFRAVVEVHLMGSVNCTKAVWDIMREQEYGRIVMTTSASGLYGNFGQASYGAAKMSVIGLMNTLVLEGHKYGIHINALAPSAYTRMTADIFSDESAEELMPPEAVTTGLLILCDEEAPTRTILAAGAGGYATTRIYETEGIYLAPEKRTPENIRARWAEVEDEAGQRVLTNAGQQTQKFLKKSKEH